MKIEQAKLIPLAEILAKMGLTPAKQKSHEAWYLSPFRNEKTASLHVSTTKNVWYDHGEGIGGDGIELVRQNLKINGEDHNVSDALRWLGNMTGYIPIIKAMPDVDYSLLDKKLVLREKKKIEHPALVGYLKSRGIPLNIAHHYLNQITILNRETQKSFFALGMANEEGGYEFRNAYFKGCVSPKMFTFIRGTKPKPEGIHLFEGMFDYLSVITRQKGKPFDNDTIILHSLSCLRMASPYINNYGYRMGYTWMDNDTAGKKATNACAEFFATQDFMAHIPMNGIYAPHKDVNAWHMKQLRP